MPAATASPISSAVEAAPAAILGSSPSMRSSASCSSAYASELARARGRTAGCRGRLARYAPGFGGSARSRGRHERRSPCDHATRAGLPTHKNARRNCRSVACAADLHPRHRFRSRAPSSKANDSRPTMALATDLSTTFAELVRLPAPCPHVVHGAHVNDVVRPPTATRRHRPTSAGCLARRSSWSPDRPRHRSAR